MSIFYQSKGRLIKLIAKYESLIESKALTADVRQRRVVQLLDDFGNRLEKNPVDKVAKKNNAFSLSSWLTRGDSSSGWLSPSESSVSQSAAQNNSQNGTQKGLYLYGGCGTGKTMLMDMFYNEVAFDQKLRIHFHEFMVDVHSRMHAIQKIDFASAAKCNTAWTAANAEAQRISLTSRTCGTADPLSRIADDIFAEFKLLCFDEFQVTHISDAVIMRRLFSFLFQKGIAIVATSNRPPDDLYLNGLNRELFTPFIPLLKSYCTVYDIDSAVDYRQAGASGEEKSSSIENRAVFGSLKDFEKKFFRLVKNDVELGLSLNVFNRDICVRKAGRSVPVALFTFRDLCDKPLGSADYIAVAKRFKCIFIQEVPSLNLFEHRDQVRRFITLIDALYDNSVWLVLHIESSDVSSILQIDESLKGSKSIDEVFAWDRTVSRLIEMMSVEYQQVHSSDLVKSIV